LNIHLSKNGEPHWGDNPLPKGAKIIGVVIVKNTRGALVKYANGNYAMGIDGKMSNLPTEEVQTLIQRSAILGQIGSIKSPLKAKASAQNGLRGGRPRKKVALN
jgi:hypothetical protein